MGLFGTGLKRLCAVVAATKASEMIGQVRIALREASTVELRLDWLRSDSERAKVLSWVQKNRPRGAILLATCRRKEGRGQLAGSVEQELFWLIRAREAGCQWCDLEIETLRRLPDHSVREYAVPPQVLLSLHDFERTPQLPRTLNAPLHGEVDGSKMATFAHSLEDSLRLLRLARRSKNFVAVPMGEVGLPARILALREGSALAYAPVEAATAPGQVSLHEMKHLYRAHKITDSTRVYGVIGDPIGHSLSPLLHNTGFAARNINAVYLPFLVHKLGEFLKAVPEFGVNGFSVTIPHKQSILKHLKKCDPLAADIGAVNTVVVAKDGSLHGSNTDYVGVLRSLEKKIKLSGSRVLVFGAGGSARAAAFAFSRAGSHVFICARREVAAKELARAVNGEAVPRRALHSEKFDAILNTTPVGMHPHDKISPLAVSELNCRIVMDLIYRPQRTQLLQIAAQKGIATVSGVEMFLAQGFAQWELWTGKRAPEAEMRRAVLTTLAKESAPAKKKSRARS